MGRLRFLRAEGRRRGTRSEEVRRRRRLFIVHSPLRAVKPKPSGRRRDRISSKRTDGRARNRRGRPHRPSARAPQHGGEGGDGTGPCVRPVRPGWPGRAPARRAGGRSRRRGRHPRRRGLAGANGARCRETVAQALSLGRGKRRQFGDDLLGSSTRRAPSRMRRWQPRASGLRIEPGRANTSRPWSAARRAVMSEPDFRLASTTSVPSDRPEMRRLRVGSGRCARWCRAGTADQGAAAAIAASARCLRG